uniref:TGB3 n=1 Tax=Garlic virus C TaxID=12431 RepID=A0A6M2YTN8_9VIRU|nr:TGB3 [Garlic virus C]
MTIVTTTYVDQTRERINDCVNAARNAVCQNINIVQASIEQHVETTSNGILNHFSAWCESIGNQIGMLPPAVGAVNERIRHLEHTLTLRNQPNDQQPFTPLNRVLFSNAALALEATRSLLSHVPPTRYNLPQTTLPLDELYGQLHALHQNSLEWLTHVGSDTDRLIVDFGTFSSTALANHNRMITHLTNISNELHTLRDIPQLINSLIKQQELHQLTLADIQKEIAALRAVVHHSQTQSQTQGSSTPSSSLSGTMTNQPQLSSLPPYQAHHPATRCRTYGTLVYNGSSLHMPMDILGKPASTALQLQVDIKPSPGGTSVSYKLADNGALLLSDEIFTPHKLNKPLSDALSLLHNNCSNFIYNNKGDRLC